MYKRITNTAAELWLHWQYLELARTTRFDPNNARIISGDPRGGTTWLAQLLNQLPGSALIWEPLMVRKVKEVRKIGFAWRQYIPENEIWPEARDVMERILSGHLMSPYLCQQTSPQQLRNANYLLVKFCRANQILPWLTRQFNFAYPPIYLVRHPCAVVASQLTQGGWTKVAPFLKIPEGRYTSFYTVHVKFLKKIDTVEKRLATIWCLCNQVPLSHPDNNKRWITITYEALLLDLAGELKRIEKRWNVSMPQHLYESRQNASWTTISGSPILNGSVQEQLEYWKSRLTARQIEDIMRVVDYFGIDLYNSDVLPRGSFT